MSDLSKLLHAIHDKNVPDAYGAIRHAVDDLKGYLKGDPVQDITGIAVHKIEDVKDDVEKVINAYLIAKLGPAYGGLAAGVADTALNSLVGVIEGVLTGAAQKK